MKRILFVTPLLFRGGAEYQLLELVRGILNSNVSVEVTVLAFYSENIKPEAIHYYSEFRELKIELVTLFDNETSFWKLFKSFRGFMRSHSFDIVHSYLSAITITLACFRRKQNGKLFLGVRNMVVYSIRDSLANRIWSSKVERYLANSKYVAEYFIDHNNVDHNKVDYIYNGYNSDKYQNVARGNLTHSELDIPNDSIILTDISNMYSHHKGHLILMDALKYLLENDSRYYLVLAGGGPLQKQFEKYAIDIGISANVRFLGFFEQTLELLSISDIYICSSFREGMSNSMMDAIMLGLPVVSTDVGAAREFINDGYNGFVVSAGNSQSISEKVEAIAQGILTADLQENARTNRKKLSTENMVGKHLEIYGIREKQY
jgi:glycosyltransferase involved in cell wall biosynthesis